MSELLIDFPELPLLLAVLIAAIVSRTARRIVVLIVVGVVVAVLLGVALRSIVDLVVEHLNVTVASMTTSACSVPTSSWPRRS